ncbi:MAG TPA: hypothetical protein PLC65_09950, partial [Bacteroidia bacterium]|nr:hypothetical protein [Bacteroidia bacterium]
MLSSVILNSNKSIRQFLLLGVFFFFLHSRAQIANYVNNGGFESCKGCESQTFYGTAYFWGAIDTTKYVGLLLSTQQGFVPNSSYTYQWPKGGGNYFISLGLWKPSTPNTQRGYPRNKLKQTLQSGHTYCVKFYANLSNQSSYGCDGLGAYFGDTSLDTIKYCDTPLSYLTPQIQYPGILTDTLNWTLVTGTFVANGTEKYMMLGNFKNDVSTNTVMTNPTNTVVTFSDILYDNVSCIDINLPAFAGRDTFFIPGDSVYLGRPSDVGIDEDCMWYKLPNTTTAIDTIAGMWVKPTATCTYVVKQDICGNIKWDTVVLYQSAIGVHELDLIGKNLKIYPQPASNEVTIQMNLQMDDPFNKYQLYNNFGQLIREEELSF